MTTNHEHLEQSSLGAIPNPLESARAVMTKKHIRSRICCNAIAASS
jgi:hypothetical protein